MPAISGPGVAIEPGGQPLSAPLTRPCRLTRCQRRVEQDGAIRFYVDETALVMLGDEVLDGGVDDEVSIQFALGLQS